MEKQPVQVEAPHYADAEASRQATDFEIIEPTTSLGASLTQVDSDPYGSRPACFSSLFQECLFVLTTTIAVGQSSIFTGAILCMTNAIGEDLGMTAAEVTWINAAQTLAAGTFLLFFGRVADLFGRRFLFLLSLAFFSICLLITGFATNAYFLDIFCGLLGLSSAASVPPAIGKLGAVYDRPSRRKNRAFACFSGGNPVGFVLGAFISGVTMQISSWRAAFWVMAVIYAFFFFAAWWTTPPDVEQTLGGLNMETFVKFDLLGAFLAVGGIAMFTASLTLAGDAPEGWATPYVIALLVVGTVLVAGFIYWQSVFRYPLMPLRVWKDRNFTLVVTVLCLGFYGFAGNLFWLTLLWQRINRLSPLMVAVHLLPAGIGGILVNVLAAMIMHRISNRLIMIIGAVSAVIASALLSAIHTSISFWALAFPALLFSVLSQDLEFTVTNMYVMSSLPSEQQSVAGGLFNTVTRLVATVGLGIQTSIYNTAGGSAEGAGALRYRPYQATFWVSLAGAFLALFLVPFLTIGCQGGRKKPANGGHED
ncbi:Major Facilitator Superfamily protein [Cladophialophora carrionii]|uniref:Major Facilitator Superfamily protein n=1 Tax=Cladophialophora carrionii TaxID=86049 RepID=A0A1C1CKH7_9EURO|nr:Major Facilitator Superfamily protein [Cladophialophora carrionii]